MSIVDSGEGWSCNSEFFTTESGSMGTLSGRTYYKVNDGPAIVFWSTGGYRQISIVSTVQNAIHTNTSSGGGDGTIVSYQYLGFTWYWNGGTYGFSSGTPVSDFPILNIRTDRAQDLTEAHFLEVMEAAGVVLSGPSFTVSYNANGGTGTMQNQQITIGTPTALSPCTFEKEESVFIGWGTSPYGPVLYSDSQIVENLAGDGETIELFAIWQANPPKLILQYNASDKEHLDKDIEDVHELDVIFKDECSIEDPTVLLEADPSFMVGVNYFTIPKFGRSYFLVTQRIIRTNLIEISGHVDVLSSFKDAIREQRAIIKRQENGDAYNLYINDNSLREYANPLVLTQYFPQGFNGFSFVMATAGVAGATPVQAPGDFTLSYEVASVGTQVTLNWTASANADSYLVMRKNPGGSVFNFWVTRATGVTALTYSESPIQLREFYYQVIALNNYGQTYSNIVQLQYQ